jgi:hypothetical protein
VIVDEAANGPDQKERVWQMVGQMMPLLQQANLPPSVWAKIVQYSPLPSALSNVIAQALLGSGQQQGAQAQPTAQGQQQAPGQAPQPGQPGGQPNGQPAAPAPQDIMAVEEHQADIDSKRASAAKDMAQAGKFQAETGLAEVRTQGLTPPVIG